jgi:uncharacterized protein (TIGR02145 family)
VITICFCLSDCKDEVILPGDLTGIVIDAFTKQPLEGALVKINPTNHTTTTGNDGKYLFNSLNPGNYEIVVSKKAYLETSKTVNVTSAYISEYDFELNPLPVIHYSDSILNFSFNLTSLSFAIAKTGTGKVDYIVTPSKNWITVDPKSGDIDAETDRITVTIDRTGLTEEKIQECIAFTFTYENNLFRDTINISLKVFPDIIFNPDLSYGAVADIEGNIYKTIQIGNDTWMAENLKTTKYNDNKAIPLVMASNQWLNLATPAYCWPENDEDYKFLYGAYYNGYAAQTGKLCPENWHVSTDDDWTRLSNNLGGNEAAIYKILERPPSWDTTDMYTNSSGFTALQSGYRLNLGGFVGGYDIGYGSIYWTSTESESANYPWTWTINSQPLWRSNLFSKKYGLSVRCVKDRK